MTRPIPGYAAQQMAEGAESGAQQQDGEAPLPPFVLTDDDRERWGNAGQAARDMLGADAGTDELWYMQRELFHNPDYKFVKQ